MTITLEVNIITRQMTSFFSFTFGALFLIYFTSAFQDLQNSIPWGPPPLDYVLWVYKIHTYAKDDTFKPANIDILFLWKIC